MTFNPLEHPVCLDFPLLVEETAWAKHIPFGMFLISVLRPQVFVRGAKNHFINLRRRTRPNQYG